MFSWTTYSDITSVIQQKLFSFGTKLIVAIIIFLIGLWLSGLISRMFKRIFDARSMEQTISTFLCKLIYSILIILVIAASLAKLGVQTASLVAFLGAMGLAVGLSLKASLSNLASGILIVIFRPFKVGEKIQVSSAEGEVMEIHILFTRLSADDQIIVVPNSMFMSNIVKNLTSKKTSNQPS